jgi:uncharacterized membrane protein
MPTNNYSDWVPYLSHPLVLSGFIMMLVVGLCTILLKTNIVRLPAERSERILEKALTYTFILGLITIIGGFSFEFARSRPSPVIMQTGLANRDGEQIRTEPLSTFHQTSLSVEENATAFDDIIVQNDCLNEINVAIHYSSSIDGKWHTTGWYNIHPSEHLTTSVKSNGTEIYFYAESYSHGYISGEWQGSDSDLRVERIVYDAAFDYADGETMQDPGAKNVIFFGRSTGQDYGEYTQTFSCNQQ